MSEEKRFKPTKPPQPIQPGQCPPEGCPPFDRIECIVVDKVYDSCFQIDDRTREFETDSENFGTGLEVGDLVQCELDGEISCNVISRTPVADGFFTLVLSVNVPVLLTNPQAAAGEDNEVETTFTFSKTVTLCAPEGVNIDCSDSSLLSCNCIVSGAEEEEEEVVYTITCDIQVCLVIRSVLTVQLLVPSYGFCVPAPCVTLPGVCPPLPPEQCF